MPPKWPRIIPGRVVVKIRPVMGMVSPRFSMAYPINGWQQYGLIFVEWYYPNMDDNNMDLSPIWLLTTTYDSWDDPQKVWCGRPVVANSQWDIKHGEICPRCYVVMDYCWKYMVDGIITNWKSIMKYDSNWTYQMGKPMKYLSWIG